MAPSASPTSHPDTDPAFPASLYAAPSPHLASASADLAPTSTITIPFPTSRLAAIALCALSVDEELSPLVRRAFTLSSPREPQTETELAGEETMLVARYAASTDRMLRVAVNGFWESVGVVLGCMGELDVGIAEREWVGWGEGEVDGLVRVQGLEEGGVVG